MFLDELSEDYETVCFDWLGMGCSSKPDIHYIKMDAQKVIRLFTDVLQSWIQETGLTDFHLVAHSLGAYISGFFLASNPTGVLSFTTVSCAGAVREPLDFNESLKKLQLPVMRKVMMHFWTFMNKGYIKGYTAFSMMPLEWIISKWAHGRLGVEGEAYKKVVKFISTMFWDKNYSSDIITRIFTYKAYAILPVCEVMHRIESKLRVFHIYGDLDWLDKSAFAEYLQQSKPNNITQTNSKQSL
jgi:pimeloyl-ACP methyl ester carboxylesterase